jgi:ADP-ribosyl-[dinitrogen reductase] hydrolase
MLESSVMAIVRTSDSDPLKIAAVIIRDGPGVIGLTFCPGKKHKGLYSGHWDRNLRSDLSVIQAFGAKILVTLMENEELSDVGVPAESLASAAKEFGLEWHHLPIRDIAIPDERFEDLWTYSGLQLRRALARGERIVVHCKGGLGRTGLVAGRLLVEFGDEPEIAIQKIRAARQGCVETAEQEKYVERCQPIPFARVRRSQEERVLACLLGGAVGDALGYEVEFLKLQQIRERFGERGIRKPILNQGKLIVSDDTQMTLFTLEGLLNSIKNSGEVDEPGIIASIRQSYLDWLDTQSGLRGKGTTGWLAHQTVMRSPRAPGNTCLSALGSGGRGTIVQPVNNSKGCGGVMRVAPLGLLGNYLATDTVFRLAVNAAAVTHGHPSGYLSAGMLAPTISLLIDGARLARPGDYQTKSALDQSCAILATFRGHEETLQAVKQALSLFEKGLSDQAAAVETLGEGWVGEECLAIALYAALSAKSFVEAVLIGANHSGDSDSTASIAGQLWGAMYGLEGIPHEWVASLDVLSPLLHLSGQLIRFIGHRVG